MEPADIRKYIHIVEGDYIPTVGHTVTVDSSSYELIRLLMKLANLETYRESADYEDKAVVMFYDPTSYERATELMKKIGVPYQDIAIQMQGDKELSPDNVNTLSPYPSNKSIQKIW